MSKTNNEAPVECSVCMKEVPKTEARVEEAADYVAYFCGLDCYEKWKTQKNNSDE